MSYHKLNLSVIYHRGGQKNIGGEIDKKRSFSGGLLYRLPLFNYWCLILVAASSELDRVCSAATKKGINTAEEITTNC
jgi:hypothetical protein